jgi:hypothetical protein
MSVKQLIIFGVLTTTPFLVELDECEVIVTVNPDCKEADGRYVPKVEDIDPEWFDLGQIIYTIGLDHKGLTNSRFPDTAMFVHLSTKYGLRQN